MADYIYLLENRLSASQKAALLAVREAARTQGLTVFLVGGAVRDLTSGSPVRDLDVAVQGNALELKEALAGAGAVITGEVAAAQALFTRFPGNVRVEIGSTLAVTYPKPGKPVAAPATILDDLRRRDFTVNAMALSLNEGSYGLLMDPLNGVADLENRQLRLVSNYGFIEDPVRMIRAVRFAARLGWSMDEKTQARYDTGKQENYITALSPFHRGYETEEIFHEEDPLRILRKLEEEGWMKHLFPALTVAKANVAELEKLRDIQTQLQMRGIHPDASSANFPLLTSKLTPAELTALKRSFARPGFVAEIEALEADAKELASQLTSKSAATPSQTWKLMHAAKPEALLWVAYSSKSTALQTKLKSFYNEWPKVRQKIPYALMQEMRIVPGLEIFDEVVEQLFFQLMDGNLNTPEEIKAFLEPYSPPAPPPAVNLRRARASKKDAKGAKGRKKATVDEEETIADVDPLGLEDEDPDEDSGEDEDDTLETAPVPPGLDADIYPALDIDDLVDDLPALDHDEEASSPDEAPIEREEDTAPQADTVPVPEPEPVATEATPPAQKLPAKKASTPKSLKQDPAPPHAVAKKSASQAVEPEPMAAKAPKAAAKAASGKEVSARDLAPATVKPAVKAIVVVPPPAKKTAPVKTASPAKSAPRKSR